MTKLSSDNLTHAVGRTARFRYEALRTQHQGLLDREERAEDRFNSQAGLMHREVFSRLYEPTTPRLDDPEDTAVARLADYMHGVCDKLPAWGQLQQQCEYRGAEASLATCSVLDELYEQELPDLADKDEEEREEALHEYVDALLDNDTGDKRGRLLAAISRATRQARQEIDALERAQVTLWGHGPSDARDEAQDNDLLSLAARLRHNRHLVRVLELLGNWRTAVKRVRRKKPSPGRITPYSVECGGSLARMLPSEKLALANPATTALTLHRMQNKQLLQYQLRSPAPVKRGAFHVLLDLSRSMQGEKRELAIAFALASMMTAADEGREVRLTSFSDTATLQDTDMSPPSRLGTIERISRLSAWGGTNFSPALDTVQPATADILLLSDGVGDVTTESLDRALQNRAELHYICIGSAYDVVEVLRRRATSMTVVSDMNIGDDLANVAASAAMMR